MMCQHAWLDLYGGMWLLLTGNPQEPAQSWVDKDTALADPQEEG
jgi:hypothetical protein